MLKLRLSLRMETYLWKLVNKPAKTLSECKFYKSVKPRSPFDAMHMKLHLFICRTTQIIHRTCHLFEMGILSQDYYILHTSIQSKLPFTKYF